MKIIFLDHDGVLCTPKEWGSRFRSGNKFDFFNKKCVEILNRMLQQDEKIQIVVSSDWRLHCDLKEMQDYYISQGVIRPPIDMTPVYKINTSSHPSQYVEITRAKEILDWINLNHKKYPIQSWCAVDDMELPLEPFVHTMDRLLSSHVTKILKHLNHPYK